MVGCNGCESWYHNRCVGIIDESKLDKIWFCTSESCRALALKYRKEKEAKKGKGSGKKNPEDSGVKSVEQRLKEMEEEQKRLEKEMETEAMLKRKEREIKRALEQKRLLLEQKLREDEEEEEYALQERVLLERRLQVQRMRERQEVFLSEMASLKDEIETLKATGKKVKPLPSVDLIGGGSGEKLKAQVSEKQKTPLRKPKAQKLPKGNQDNLNDDENDEDDNDDESSNEENFSNEENSSNKENSCDEEKSSEKQDDENGKFENEERQKNPNPKRKINRMSQLAARSGVTKKLPNFSGKLEEWPLFYSSYQVIEKLRTLYGHPELLLQCQLERDRKLEPPEVGKLASFVPFGIAIENTTEEARGVVLFHEVVTADRCSRWTTLLRGTEYTLRFINNCKLKKKGLSIITTKATEKHRLLINAQYTSVLQPLSQEEHQKADTVLWKQAQ
ncbi:DNA ligase 1-like [Wyeomyia smithii]|uniref:DNA ligase 1-like n=1 Tax=Wyeomyia smithii TaxID=174621 RepID=UPI002467F286|nr:DNA ligase 1-like [Wyeomyia smithii]